MCVAEFSVGAEAEAVTAEVVRWIEGRLGPGYPWPGNMRELEQCVRNVVIHRAYEPPQLEPRTPDEQLMHAMSNGKLTADELLCRYCTMVCAQNGSYEATGRRLGLDRRTVKARIDRDLLDRSM